MKLYKYRTFGEFTNRIIINSQLYFSPISKLNDPFDCRLSFKQDYTEKEIIKSLRTDEKKEDFISRRNKVTNQMIEEVGVLSLAKKADNLLMWSHYANEHKGLAFEFETSMFNFTSVSGMQEQDINPILVDYDCNYDELSYIADQTKELTKLLLTKFVNWSYEKEYRMIDLYQSGVKIFQKEALTSIIFGSKADACDMQKFIELCDKHGFSHLKFKKARVCIGKFELEFDDMDK